MFRRDQKGSHRPPTTESDQQGSPTKHSRRTCPQCGSPTYRVHRTIADRLLSLVMPLYRYRCNNCSWSGLRRYQ